MTFGEKLQRLRAREGLSQDALAELLNVSRQAVSRWERDETMPETEKVIRISEHFHVTTDYLLKDGPEHAAPPSHSLPDPAEVWRKYGFLLAWAAALWGVILCLRMLPAAIVISNEGLSTLFFRMALRWLSPGVSVIAGGLLWARRWRRAGRFRRQDLGWALALGGGLILSAWLLVILVDQVLGASYSVAGALRFFLWPLLPLALGLLLALLPPRRDRETP